MSDDDSDVGCLKWLSVNNICNALWLVGDPLPCLCCRLHLVIAGFNMTVISLLPINMLLQNVSDSSYWTAVWVTWTFCSYQYYSYQQLALLHHRQTRKSANIISQQSHVTTKITCVLIIVIGLKMVRRKDSNSLHHPQKEIPNSSLYWQHPLHQPCQHLHSATQQQD